ncbi:hypothetical protein O0I10_013050 [Lichtheimia ornata]|uniref:Uncharacterized protein n=1 Tax=Lichtheimia ornata TaxID=688661 RepID=A0AAD7UQ91_9FUNG|nr:uncharacterized protein O0I10_013050 [Lichtheimia ornata]KAJ8651408.1 hypothetical protein O0I10_013050 [Lichtheimia ornata]
MPVIGGSYQQQAQEAAAMSNRVHTFNVNNSYSNFWWFTLLANYYQQEYPAAHVAYGCVTSATRYNVYVFWCYQGISIAQGSRHQATFLPPKNDYQQSFIVFASLQQGNPLWVLDNIKQYIFPYGFD